MKYKYNNNFNELGANVTNNFPYRPIDGLPQVEGWSVVESESSATEDNILYFVLDSTAKDLLKTPVNISAGAQVEITKFGGLTSLNVRVENSEKDEISITTANVDLTSSEVLSINKEYFVNRSKPEYIKISGKILKNMVTAGGPTTATIILYGNGETLYKASGTGTVHTISTVLYSEIPLTEDSSNTLSWFEAIQQCTAVGIIVFAGEEDK